VHEATTFGPLLRRWRAARNQSQLDLSMTVGVSARHLSFLETGRANPSRKMVLSLGEALDVPLRDRNALLRAAGFADRYPERSLGAVELEGARRALEFVLARHEPNPAMALDAGWTVQLANAAATKLFARFVKRMPPPPHNMVRLLFDPEGGRPALENFPEVARAMLGRLQREAAAAPDSASARLLKEIAPTVGDLPPLSSRDPTPAIIPLTLRDGDLRLSLISLIATFGTPLDVTLHELRIETFFPADAASEAVLRSLVAD
jgi:transcriptional regulator with XRE-family HTH domain